MKRLAIAVIIIGVIFGGITFFKTSTIVVTNPEPQVVVETQTEDALEKAIKEAQEAKKSEMEVVAQKAYQDAYDQEMTKVEAEVVDTYYAKLGERKVELDKKTGAYWRVQGNIIRLIKQTFPEEPQKAVAIAMAESRLNPQALNAKDSHKGCKGSYGIFQIGCLHETDPEILYDVEYNIKRARELYDQEGWKPWGAYTDGSYKFYLAQR